MSITQPVCVCVFVALGIQHAMRHIDVCGLPHSTTISHFVSQTARFYKKGHLKQNVCFDFLYNISKTFLILRKPE
jgi:hypothetical protein